MNHTQLWHRLAGLLLLGGALLPVTTAHAQAPLAIKWQHCYGGTLRDEPSGIQLTPDKGYIVAGYSISTNGDVTGNHGSNDAWIVKIDSVGTTQWAKSYGSSGQDEADCIRTTFDSGYVFAGIATNSNGDVSGAHGQRDFWVVKIDSVGTIQWQRALGGSGDDWAKNIRQTADSGFVVVGYSSSTNGDVTGNHGDQDYWVVKLDASGNLQWQKSFGGTLQDEGTDVMQTSDGGYMVIGAALSFNGNVTGHHGVVAGGQYDYWVLKLDALGALQWQKALGGSNGDYANQLTQTPSGKFVITGNSYSSDGDLTRNHGNSDFWIVEIDASGNLLWQKSYGGLYTEASRPLACTSDGGFLVGGWTDSNDGDVTGNHYRDSWLIHLDSSGNLLWEQCYGGSSDEIATSVQATGDNGAILCSVSQSNDFDVSGNHGQQDYWIVKLGPAPILSAVGSLTFATLLCDSIAADTFWVRNTGTDSLHLTAASILGPEAVEFTFSSSAPFPTTLAPGDSVRVIVVLTARTTGAKKDTLSITSDDPFPGHNPWKIVLRGTKDRIAFTAPDSIVVASLHAGSSLDTLVVFRATGTLTDTITVLQRVSGVSWISAVAPPLPKAVKITPPLDTAQLRFHLAAPRDTGWFSAQFRLRVEPCGIDTILTIRVHVVSGVLRATASINEPTLICSSSQCDSFALHNTGNSTLHVLSLRFNGGDASQFGNLVPLPPLTIAAGDSAIVHFCFQPTDGNIGTYATTILLGSDDSLSPSNPFAIAVTSRKDSSSIALTPGNIDLGSVCVGQLICANESLFAYGSVKDTIVAVNRVSGSNAFSVTGPTTPFILAPGTSGQITVCFMPVDTGVVSADFVALVQPCGRVERFTVSGRGVRQSILALDSLVDFGSVPLGVIQHRTARMLVTQPESLSIAGLTFNPSIGPFTIDSTQPPLPIVAREGDTITVYLSYKPVGESQDSARMESAVAAACGPPPTLLISGRGVRGHLLSDRVSIGYGAVVCTGLGTDSVRVTNAASVNLTISASISGVNAGDFSIASPPIFTLLPRDSKTLQINFVPRAIGARTAALFLEVKDGLGNNDTVVVALSGRLDTIGLGIAGTVNDTLDFGTLPLNVGKSSPIVLINRSSGSTTFALRSSDVARYTVAAPTVALSSSSAQQTVVITFSGGSSAGVYNAMLILTDTCGRQDTVYLHAVVDSMGFEITTVRDTTVCPADSAVRHIWVRNFAPITQTLHIGGSGALYTITPDSLVLAPGDSGVITVVFKGSITAGRYTVAYDLQDGAGVHRSLSVTVAVDDGAVTAQALSDTTICPGTSITRTIVIHNERSVEQRFQLAGGDPFAFVPSSLTIPAGDSATVEVHFLGSTTPGVYTLHYDLPGCSIDNAIVARVHVVAPAIGVPSTLLIEACPGETITAELPVVNGDSVGHTVSYVSARGTLSHAGRFLLPGVADSLRITIGGLASGVDSSVVHILDECGVDHIVVLILNVRGESPIHFSLQSMPAAKSVGIERVVYVTGQGNSPTALSEVTLVVDNEPTSLQLIRATSNIPLLATPLLNSVSLSLAAVNFKNAPLPDTIAELHYRTLVGSTLTPQVSLRSAVGASVCDTTSASREVTIPLLPPGCELGTVAVHPYATGIQSIFPNPAAGVTTITYSTASEAQVTLTLLDALGRVVHTLPQPTSKAGTYTAPLDAGAMQSGAYQILLRSGSLVDVRSLFVVH